ncbi:LuxR family transcriptional regulator [Streptomyces eurocidicus]|uniref:DNA-binding NarL/FixJ family response regulator n=1 Tax=Streptomyces eurocidicus TaxID=66423 RepID=A0A2N8NT33_STREU|nr:response regulator transcription factor [Streptomyces eurocidicus]MBB5119259.1 DNA-binding NarL/FixJ family response regulator [Streptomyces eurocidicus]MBF6053154.1 response regulator [Streptomyces eurocidicus]PNE31936.1 LuxR family transcriptional regulator [Streptomyces eurocidicus]
MTQRRTRVLVVDDEILIREGLAALLRATPDLEVCGQAESGEQAVAMAGEHHPDIVLMDIRLRGLNGVAATGRILAEAPGPRPRILILTTYDLDEYVYAALRAGASGFLLKDTPPERLFTAIRTVAAGDMLFAPTVTRRLIEAYTTRHAAPAAAPAPASDPASPATSTSTVETEERLAPLTRRERDILGLVGRGLTNPEIATRLTVSISTVKTHVNRIMTKLDLTSRAQAVTLAYESGLIRPTVVQRFS